MKVSSFIIWIISDFLTRSHSHYYINKHVLFVLFLKNVNANNISFKIMSCIMKKIISSKWTNRRSWNNVLITIWETSKLLKFHCSSEGSKRSQKSAKFTSITPWTPVGSSHVQFPESLYNVDSSTYKLHNPSRIPLWMLVMIWKQEVLELMENNTIVQWHGDLRWEAELTVNVNLMFYNSFWDGCVKILPKL